jgi:hypothetical protein
MEWSDGVCEKCGLEKSKVWKVFKRSLVARWFGKVEKQLFKPGWSVEEALEYANRFPGRSIQFSLFPEAIACGARNIQLPWDQREKRNEILSGIDNSIAMEMFPESSSNESICFRRFTTEYGEEVIYEAGKGQAMFVFEQEQGKHEIVEATKSGKDFVYSRRNAENRDSRELEEIEKKLRTLIKVYDNNLGGNCLGICRALGFKQLSIEGYFDPTRDNNLLVIDLDLPFDFVFMVHRTV